MLTELSPFSNVVCKIEITGAQLQAALNFGVSRLPAASGQFPQVSGMTFRVILAAPINNRVRDLKVHGAPVDPAKTYTLALPDFVLHGGDGYEMFAKAKVLIAPEDGASIATAVENAVSGRDVEPRVEGRIVIER